MAFAAPLIPYVLAGTAAYSAGKQADTAYYNAASSANEAKLSVDQANTQANQVSRASRQQLGKQLAAFGAADVGYGGSTAGALDDSVLNQEKDALNTRYKGTLTAYGYNTQSQLDQQQSSEYTALAGANALEQVGKSYTYTPGAPPPQVGNPAASSAG